MIRVPEEFAALTVAREGAAGARWIAALPGLAAGLLYDWRLVPVARMTHGLVALVQPVRDERGRACVLKVSWLDDETRHEAAALHHWAGRGAVVLLRADRRRHAMLLEMLDARVSLQLPPIGHALDAAGGLLRQLHVPAPRELATTLATTTNVAARWHHVLIAEWHRLGRPGEARLIDAATWTCAELAATRSPAASAVLLHGDFHFGNVLAGARQPWNAIDPKPLVGAREYDLLPLLRNRWAELVADGGPSRGVRHRLARLVEATGMDAEAARRWVFVRTVSDALWGRARGDARFEAIAWDIARALGYGYG